MKTINASELRFTHMKLKLNINNFIISKMQSMSFFCSRVDVYHE